MNILQGVEMEKGLLKNQKAFTLIEIITVLVILGILAAIAVPKFYSFKRAAEAKTLFVIKNDLRSRANTCFSKSMLANNGAARAADCQNLSLLGLSSVADVTAAYKNFAGTFAWVANRVTYTYKNSGATPTATFTITAGSTTTPPVITFAGSV